MQLGLHVSDFTWPGGPLTLGRDLAAVARTADEIGFDRLSVMDHFFQIEMIGPPEHEMLESTTTLGYLAAITKQVKLLTLVTGVVYRPPALVAKAVTTLDVLSGGRAMLGIGAAWFEGEASALGFPFPPLGERFERLEETLQICLQMWSGSDEPYEGAHYQLERTLNIPAALSRPHPPILIGGSGEQRTLRLVARYAQACNLYGRGDVAHKLDVLRQRCEEENSDYEAIEKTVLFNFDPGEHGERINEMVEQLGALAALGFTVAHGSVKDVFELGPLELIGERLLPQIASL